MERLRKPPVANPAAAHMVLAADVEDGLKIFIPAVGQLVRFERHLVVDEEIRAGFSYRG